MQEAWVKQCLIASEFVLQCGQQTISVLERMEKHGKVTGYVLKPLEGLAVPEDWSKVAAQMLMPEHKATASRLRDVASTVIRDRWWVWILLHPDLGENYIHPSRSMFTPCFLSPAVCLGMCC